MEEGSGRPDLFRRRPCSVSSRLLRFAPAPLLIAQIAGHRVTIRVSLEGGLAVYDGEQLVAWHRLAPAERGWVTVPAHHAALWAQTLDVERRPLAVYEEVTSWS